MARYNTENTLAIGRPCVDFADGVALSGVVDADDDLNFAVVIEPDVPSRQRLVLGDIIVSLVGSKERFKS